jgi:hypothetical protein
MSNISTPPGSNRGDLQLEENNQILSKSAIRESENTHHASSVDYLRVPESRNPNKETLSGRVSGSKERDMNKSFNSS